jgi:hypothetical protein
MKSWQAIIPAAAQSVNGWQVGRVLAAPPPSAAHSSHNIPQPGGTIGFGGMAMAKVIEIRACDICQRLRPRKRLQTFCDMLLCRDCYRRYTYF